MSQDMDHRSNKHMNSEPMPGTSRSLLELQDNDGFGDDFGRKTFDCILRISFFLTLRCFRARCWSVRRRFIR